MEWFIRARMNKLKSELRVTKILVVPSSHLPRIYNYVVNKYNDIPYLQKIQKAVVSKNAWRQIL